MHLRNNPQRNQHPPLWTPHIGYPPPRPHRKTMGLRNMHKMRLRYVTNQDTKTNTHPQREKTTPTHRPTNHPNSNKSNHGDQPMNQLRQILTPLREHFQTLTKTTFYLTLGSLATLILAAPTTQLTQQILPLEIGLLIGVTLGYLSQGRDHQ